MSWWSPKQSVTASSTMEAEYVVCYEATRHAVSFRNFIRDFGVVDSIERPIMMYYYNTIAVSFSNNLKGNPNAKYIDVKYFVVNEKVEECKTRQKSNFSKERKNSNLPLQYNLKT